MTSILTLRFSNSFAAIANQSRLSDDVELRFLRPKNNDDVIFGTEVLIYTKNEIIE
jgi:hypothetical protein